MRKIIIISCVICFCLGYVIRVPKTIIREKEVKVYDLSQNPEMISVYAKAMGMKLISREEIEKNNMHQYKLGYQQGFMEGVKKEMNINQ